MNIDVSAPLRRLVGVRGREEEAHDVSRVEQPLERVSAREHPSA